MKEKTLPKLRKGRECEQEEEERCEEEEKCLMVLWLHQNQPSISFTCVFQMGGIPQFGLPLP